MKRLGLVLRELLLQDLADAGCEVLERSDAGLEARGVADLDDVVEGAEVGLDAEPGRDHLAFVHGHARVELLEVAVARHAGRRA